MDRLSDLIQQRVQRHTAIETDATPGAWSWLDDARHDLDVQTLHRIVSIAQRTTIARKIRRTDLRKAKRRVCGGGWRV